MQNLKYKFKDQCEAYKDELTNYENVWTNNAEQSKTLRNQLATMELQKEEVNTLIKNEEKLIKQKTLELENELPAELQILDTKLDNIEAEQKEIIYELKKYTQDLEIRNIEVEQQKRLICSFHKSVINIGSNSLLTKTNRSQLITRESFEYKEKQNSSTIEEAR